MSVVSIHRDGKYRICLNQAMISEHVSEVRAAQLAAEVILKAQAECAKLIIDAAYREVERVKSGLQIGL